MDYLQSIERYLPVNEQEKEEKREIGRAHV